ncbi:MAG: hypothetical protein IJV35_03500 [Neisseriaceae bacterium]|nr:hypothetical protein [Neisseriaceae bacterium]
MWLVELANKIHLAEYHMLYFFIFLLCSGLYRMYDGRRRLLFEQQPDDRVNLIPDDDVVQLWHNLTKLNIKFGHFFQKYGLFLMSCAVVNILLFFKTHLTIQEIIKHFGLFSIIVLAIIFITWVIGIFILGESNRSMRYTNSFLLTLTTKKNDIAELYKRYGYKSISQWEKDINHHGRDFAVVNEWIGKEKHIVIGSIIHYSSWLLLIILVTAFHSLTFLGF